MPATGPSVVPFRFFAAGDVEVEPDGVAVIGLSVTGEGSPTGGTLTLAAAVSNCTIVICRDTSPERATDVPATGPLRTDKPNTDLDRMMAVDQGQRVKVGRVIRLPAGEPKLPELPSEMDRRNMVLGLGATGALALLPISPGGAVPPSADSLGLLSAPGDIATKLREWVSDNDHPTLQAAINAAAGKILLLTRAHVLTAAVTVGSLVTAPVHVLAMPGASVTQTVSGQDGLRIVGHHCTIEGLTITGTNSGTGRAIRAMPGVRMPSVDRVTLQDWRYGCAYEGVKGGRISRCVAKGGTADGNASADFFLYAASGNTNDRITVDNVFALSNNDNGISIATNNGERNVTLANFLVVPCDPTGTTELAQADVRRRFGVVVGYNGGADVRAAVGNGVVRNCAYAGLYSQGSALPAGTVAWSNIVVSRCGFGAFFEGDESLRAGILVASGGADTWTGISVVDCFQAGLKFCPQAGYSAANAMRATFTGLTIARTTGYGLWLTNKPARATFSGYSITQSTKASVYFETTSTDAGGVVFGDGRVEVTGAEGGFVISAQAGGVDTIHPVTIGGAIQVVGADTTTNDQFNAALWAEGNVQVRGMHASKFHRGVNWAQVTNTRRIDRVIDDLFLEDCTFGLHGAGTGTLLATRVRFKNCPTKTNGAFVAGALVGEAIHFQAASAPAAGAWAQGDMGWHPAPTAGNPYHFVCVAGGSPGTWVSKTL